MRLPSLRLRLLLGAAIGLFVALALAWIGMTWLFERHVERRETQALIRSAETLIADLRIGPDGAPIADTPLQDNRFESLASGLYWQLATPKGAQRSFSLWDQSLPRPDRPSATAWTTDEKMGPFREELMIVSRLIRPDRHGPQVLVQVAQDNREMEIAYTEFGRELAASLALLWLALSVAAYAQVGLGLRPLARIQGEIDRLRRSAAARLSGDYPREVSPLTGAINALADTREADLVRARKRAADLAHSLKTPLAVLAAQSRRARAAGAIEPADGLDRAIAAVGAALEAELARSRAAAARGAAEIADSCPATVTEGLISVIERTEHGERIVFDTDFADGLRAPVATEDLAELLGALIENAVRHARRVVRVAGRIEGDGVTLSVEDDGPGIAEDHAAAALVRGGRLDEAGPGHGLGLSIVRDLVEATEGSIALGRSDMGGLRVTLVWPNEPR